MGATAIPAGLTLIAESTVQSMLRTIGASDVIAGKL